MLRGRYGKPTSEDGALQIDSAAPVKEEGSEVKLAPTTEDFSGDASFTITANKSLTLTVTINSSGTASSSVS